MGKQKVISEAKVTSRLPEKYETLGIVDKLLGSERVMVRCLDGFNRLCRIRGKMKRRVWVRVNDNVIVVPWDFQSESRGDIVHRYRRNDVDWLRSKGYFAESL